MSDSDSEDITPSQPVNDNADLPALFWDSMPDNAEEHPDYIAMKALEEESTPEERAENFKQQGNNKLRVGLKSKNRLLLREAVEAYTKGLALKCSDTQLNLALHNNRAHVHSLLGNWRSALQDSLAALQLEPASIKAVFRGARAALKLGQWDVCGQLLQQGLALEPEAAELLQIQQELAASRKQHEDQQAAQAAAREAALAPSRKLAAAIVLKGYRLTLPEVHVGSKQPYVDKQGALHWPVMLLYPETGQQDVIEDWHEEDLVAEHLDVMFGPDAPSIDWDTAGEYSRQRVQLYYLSNAGQPLEQDQLVGALHGKWPERDPQAGPKRYGSSSSHWVPVDESLSLRQVLLAPDHVIPGVPLFWVLARDTQYQARFLAEELRRF
uniref:Cns1/TTC4 wheel domain-containing protein n=1 Tax=Tetradesmus obliquus TaxID=3088 RepID=A0A383V5T9_TETOB|eukprot:jgi/Sobl393_1/3486/SZX60975.1